MNVLDSSLEALAFNYGFLTAVNNIWAWVALITAAVSFWKIKALSSTASAASKPEPISIFRVRDDRLSLLQPKMAERVVPPAISTPQDRKHLLDLAQTVSIPGEGGTKGKFTLYYEDVDYREGDNCEDEDNCGGNGGGAVVGEKLELWSDDLEKVMLLRMGDMGWYKYQDLRVLDGSVVRLWGGCRQRNATAL